MAETEITEFRKDESSPFQNSANISSLSVAQLYF